MDRLSVSECKALLSRASIAELPRVIERFGSDERKGVADALAAAERRFGRHVDEQQRLTALSEVESALHEAGYTHVAGVDEVGRGALAGPLTIGAVILPCQARIDGLDDSKRLSPARREALDATIRAAAISYAVVHISAEEIDAIGISAATRRAICLALAALDPAADHVIVDGLGVGGLGVPETAVVGGDGLCAAVAAASIIAKVTRDALMRSYDSELPQYGFALNKGYGTSDHVAAISTHGLSDLHRRSFSPCGGTMPLF